MPNYNKASVIGEIQSKMNLNNKPVFAAERNLEQMHRVLDGAMRDETIVPFKPYGKNLLDSYGLEEVAIDAKISIAEANWIAKLIDIIHKHHGEPEFNYDKVEPSRYEDVDEWRNLVKVGRETGPEAGRRRAEAIENLQNVPSGQTINPEPHALDWAIDTVLSVYQSDVIGDDGATAGGVPYSTETSTTNAGYTTYLRKSKDLAGVPVREIIASQSKKLEIEEMYNAPAFCAARGQRGKWSINDSKFKDEQELIKYLVSLNHDEKVKVLLETVGFDNFKARIIAAAPSFTVLKQSPILSPLVVAEQSNPMSMMVHLKHPDDLEEGFTKINAFCEHMATKHKIYLRGEGLDVETFDRLQRLFHAEVAYRATAPKIRRAYDKKLFAYTIAGAISRNIDYKTPEQVGTDKWSTLRLFYTLRSGEGCTNYFGSKVTTVAVHYSRYRANNKWSFIVNEAKKFGAQIVYGNGDDQWTLFEVGSDGTTREDRQATIKILIEEFGLLLNDGKGESGNFFGQMRLTDDGRFIAPVTRMRIIWKESTLGALPPYTETVSLFQNLETRRGCKSIAEFVNELIIPFDNTKIGTVDIVNGKPITFRQFKKFLKIEARNEGKTTVEMIYKGNPFDDHTLTSDKANINDDWLREQWEYWKGVIQGSASNRHD